MSLQVYAGHKSGSKAAVHTMHEIFKADETDAALLVDASNTINSLNRTAALHNIRVLCPTIAIYAINIYRAPSRLLVIRGKELGSSEGTTQGEPVRCQSTALEYAFKHLKLSKAVLVRGRCYRIRVAG